MTYRMLTNLADVCRKAGLKVKEVDGWEKRGRPSSTGGFNPVGVLCHHTATRASSSDADVIRLLVNGRSDLPGPLCQLGLGRDGTVYVVAAGRANHGGKARASGTVAGGDANSLYIGIEAFNDGVGEKWNAVQYDAYVKLAAVLCREITGNSAATVRGHKETSVTGKIDPTFDMHSFRERVDALLEDKPKPPKPPKTPAKRATLGTFNLLRGRARRVVVCEVHALFDEFDLDGLAVQEAEGYFTALNKMKGLDYFADPENAECGILVPKGRGTKFMAREHGDGWKRVGGSTRAPLILPRVTIDDWLRFASTHWPPATDWPGGVLKAPPARRDDVIAIAEATKEFLSQPQRTRVVAGDFNERPETTGKWSPGWVAKETGSVLKSPRSRKGHGRIDWAIAKRGTLSGVKKVSGSGEKSDHDPVIFTVTQGKS